MKIILFLVLAGLSLAQENSNCPEEPIPKDKYQCLIEALQNDSKIMKYFKAYLCNYKGTSDESKANYEIAARALIKSLDCAGCPAHYYLGAGNTYEELLKDPKKLEEESPAIFRKVIEVIGVRKETEAFVCGLTEDSPAASECLEFLLQGNIKTLIVFIRPLLCLVDLSKLTGSQYMKLLSPLGCTEDFTDDLDEALKKYGVNHKDVVENMIDLLTKSLPGSSVLNLGEVCKAGGVVLGAVLGAVGGLFG